MATSNALKTLYASGGTQIRVACLSFRCAAWASDVHLCQGWQDMTAKLEGGEVVTFLASDFAAQLPRKASEGNQSLNFIIDPGESDAVSLLDLALASGERVYIDYREYLQEDLTTPARSVETLNVISYSYTPVTDEAGGQLSFTASFYDLTNEAWPRLRYTTSLAPGLKHYGS